MSSGQDFAAAVARTLERSTDVDACVALVGEVDRLLKEAARHLQDGDCAAYEVRPGACAAYHWPKCILPCTPCSGDPVRTARGRAGRPLSKPARGSQE